MKNTSGPRLSRRALLQGTAAAAITGAAITSTAEAHAPEKWDREVDVVVMGGGTGLNAALVAAKAGLKVLLLEKGAGIGGNTIVSGGVLWVPNNHVLKREGLSDSREQAIQYLTQLSQEQSTPDVIEAFVDHGPEMLEFVEKNTSLRWRVSLMMGEVADYHPTWKGGMHKGRSVEPVMPALGMAGGVLIAGLLGAVSKLGVEILTSAPATRLIAKETPTGKEVLGVEANYQGKPLRVRARHGVLVATGGFERNLVMKRHFLRGPSPYTLGAETNNGDGIHLGMSIGADLRNMNEAWGITVYKAEAVERGAVRAGISLNAQVERRNPGGICVNRYGERFGNEASDYDSAWRTFHVFENWGETGYHNIPAYQIFDQSAREEWTVAGRTKDQPLPAWVATGDTLEALAAKLGIDATGLTATVEQFNRDAAAGRDPVYHRGESPYDTYGGDVKRTLTPLARGPYYGAEVAPGDVGTCGGLRVNGKAQVIDVFDRPLQRLYASGNTSGVGSPGAMYGGGGGTLGPAMTFAYIAATELVALEPVKA